MNAGRDLAIFGSALLVIALFFLVSSLSFREKQEEAVITEPYRATLTGVQVCLSHKDTDGPITLECAIGMKTDDGEYYALSFDLSSASHPDISNGERFSASGIVTPIERLSTGEWQKYEVQGIFSVTDSFQLEDDFETSADIDPDSPQNEGDEPIATAKCYVGGCSSQICSDAPDAMSDCMYRPEYMCYKDAVCERQASGQCGWTDTATLKACLQNPAAPN